MSRQNFTTVRDSSIPREETHMTYSVVMVMEREIPAALWGVGGGGGGGREKGRDYIDHEPKFTRLINCPWDTMTVLLHYV